MKSKCTYKDLADRAGISEVFMIKIAYGEKRPGRKTVQSVSEATGISVVDLLFAPSDTIRKKFKELKKRRTKKRPTKQEGI